MTNVLPFYVPEIFRYSIKEIQDNNVTLYAELKVAKECDEWIAEFSNLTSSRWVVRRTKPESTRLLCRKDYVCHRNSFRKKASEKRSSKNLECEASISIVIKLTTAVTKKRHQHIKDNLPAIITINNNHSHSLEAPDSTGVLRASSDTRKQFEAYFQDGFGITRAINYHLSKVELELDETELAKSTVNPKYRTVRYWYEMWRELNPGPVPEAGVLEKLREKQEEYKKLGITVKIEERPFTIIIVTPLMKRAHHLPTANDVYVHSCTSCDSDQSSLTFLFTNSVAGAVPLAIIITKKLTLANYTFVFQLWKSVLRKASLNTPKLFITDDNDDERKALQAVFPNAKFLLCSFYIAHGVWKWLWDIDHGILEFDRLMLYQSFKNILVAPSILAAENAFHAAMAEVAANKYPQWLSYLAEYWIRRKSWCLCYRDTTTQENLSNQLTEVSIRLYKNILLRKSKPYSVIALVDFTSIGMERYWVRRFQNFAYGKSEKTLPFLKTQIDKAAYLSKDMIIRNGEYWFIVPSEKQLEVYYDVDMQYGCCSCETGRVGTWCKHQTGVYTFFFNTNVVVTADDRYNIAMLALGDRADKKEFFPMMTITSTATKIENLQDIQEETYAETSQDSTSSNNDNFADTETITENSPVDKGDDSFLKLIELMKSKHELFGTSQVNIKRCLKRLQRVKSKASWDIFLRSFGNDVTQRRVPKTTATVKVTRSKKAAQTTKSETDIQKQPAAIVEKKIVVKKSCRLTKGDSTCAQLSIKKKRKSGEVDKKEPNMGYHFIFLSQTKDASKQK